MFRIILSSPRRSTLVCATWLVCSGAAQADSTPATDTAPARLETIMITGRSATPPSIGGWDQPAAKLPFQAGSYDSETLREAGVRRLSDITRIDAAVSDAYNTEGYWDYLTVRGFVIDNRFNYRRDGLPINAETSIPLENKERVEVLLGTSGLQAGTSAPGGLVNFVVKRPLATPLRQLQFGWRERGSLLGAVDISQRFGAGQAFGLRINAAAERLRPDMRAADGSRRLLAIAGEWKATRSTLIEAEFETSHRSQPSVPGFSLLGNRVPTPSDPRINLNDQPWSLPVVLDGDVGSLRVTHAFADDWRASAHLARQQLRSDDRVAFPFGCYDSGSDVYYADRYCPDGRFDLYDFRSDDERRRTDAIELTLKGRLRTGGIGHDVAFGVLRSQVRNRFRRAANNFVGQGNVQGTAITPADPALSDDNTNRDERSTELSARDALRLTPALTAWAGLRHTRLERDSVRTDGSQPLGYRQSFTTPWLAASYALGGADVYASWGQGIESEAVPNRARFTNRGQALPALRSRQVEIGIKAVAGTGGGGSSRLEWGAALFDTSRPAFNDLGTDCSNDAPGATCTRRADGDAVHRGIDVNASWRSGRWTVDGSAQWLHARRHGSVDATINGQRPTNVPATTLKLQARHDVAALPGLGLLAGLVVESDRIVLPDHSARIPGWARIDAGLRYLQPTAGASLLWRIGIDNLFDRRAWRESPYQFGHAYLFPLAPRALRASLEFNL